MRKAGEIISALFKERFGPEFMETARVSAGLFSSWAKIVAEVWPPSFRDDQKKEDIPAAAVHSRIRELERGLLLVEADHPGWIQILQTKQKELLSLIQRRFPGLGVKALAFRLSRQQFPFLEPAVSASGKQNEAENKSPPRNSSPQRPAKKTRPRPASRIRGAAPKDEDFYTALKGLEESIKQRNGF